MIRYQLVRQHLPLDRFNYLPLNNLCLVMNQAHKCT